MAGHEATTPDPSQTSTQGIVWVLLALAFLVGTALVSLVELTERGTAEAGRLPATGVDSDEMLVIIAPGQEHLLLQSDLPSRFAFLPIGERLPAIDDGYQVLVPGDRAIPRLPDEWTVSSEEDLEGWRLVHVDSTSPRVSRSPNQLDLGQELHRARVFFRDPDGHEIPCDRWRFGRWGCGLEEWLWVGPTELELRGATRSCIWAHPRAGYELVIRFPGLPVGSRLSGRYGLSDSAAAVPDGAPVGFAIRAGPVERQYVAENRPGFFPYQVALDGIQSGTADVEFIVTTENDGRRHFCFTGTMQGIGVGTQ